YPPKKTKKEQDAELPAWKALEGFTKEKKLGEDGKEGSLGPIRIRKTTDDLTKSLGEAKGATVGYSDNRLSQGSGAWNTEGVLNYPIALYGGRGRAGSSAEAEFGPAVAWKLSQVQGNKKKD